MTTRQLYEAVLIELNKSNAPNILLEDFNYFANKSINQYINKRYNIYDVNQLTTDDLRVLKATAILTPHKTNKYDALSLANMATYEVTLPEDYLHILNCICIYRLNKTYKCYNQNDTWRAAATRLTADAYSQVLDNFWNKPTYKRPYYYIHNVNVSPSVPTNPYSNTNLYGTDVTVLANVVTRRYLTYNGEEYQSLGTNVYSYRGGTITIEGWLNSTTGITYYTEANSSLNPSRLYRSTSLVGNVFNGTDYIDLGSDECQITERTKSTNMSSDAHGNAIYNYSNNINLFTNKSGTSNVERTGLVRYGNTSLVRLEIRYGTDNSVFQLEKVYIDYIKAPLHIRLTQEELDYTEDKSQMLEYPDYVCQEIVNELVHIIMENISDLRILTHPVVSLSIANPAQQLTEPVAQQLS